MNPTPLEKKLRDLGLPMMELQSDENVNQTLAEIVQSSDTRHWEGFPVVLAQANKQGKFNADDAGKYLQGENENETFRQMICLSLALYRCFSAFHSENAWIKNLEEGLKKLGADCIEKYKTLLVSKETVSVSGRSFSAERLFKMFEYYLRQSSEQMKQKAEQLEDLSLEYALSQVFSPKQKELFKKKLDGEVLTKTEKEYFSRAVKKKVLALANSELHRLARKLLE